MFFVVTERLSSPPTFTILNNDDNKCDDLHAYMQLIFPSLLRFLAWHASGCLRVADELLRGCLASKPETQPQPPEDTARTLNIQCLLLRVSGSTSAHLAQVKTALSARSALQVYKGNLLKDGVPPGAKKIDFPDHANISRNMFANERRHRANAIYNG